jgi:hypothetical protein
MELRDEICRKLDSVNAVQIVGGKSYTVDANNRSLYREVGNPDMFKNQLEGHKMVDMLCKMPHETRKRGTVLIITPINLLGEENTSPKQSPVIEGS